MLKERQFASERKLLKSSFILGSYEISAYYLELSTIDVFLFISLSCY